MTALLIPTIPKARSADPGLDQQQLFERGLEHVRRLARHRWTDHNLHDPGITILELLSYALTDIGYRAGFPVEDLLASPGGNAANAEAMARQFFTARQILPNRPLTLLDYRKLLIDLEGVRNAWVLPAELIYFADPVRGELLHERPNLPDIREVPIRGLYRVVLDYMDDVRPEAREEVDARALALLRANRNLCEDFVAVDGVETQDFVLCADLELAPDADAARVQAEILFQVERSLHPPVRNYRLSEMLERPWSDGRRRTVEEIFDGPLLAHGFLDDEELERAELPAVLRLSDVISVLMDIEGVRAVRDIVINPEGTTAPLTDKWQVPVAPGRRPTLSPEGSRLVLYKRQMPVVPPAEAVAGHLERLRKEERSKLEEEMADDLPIPLGRFRQPDRYTSFQNDFPALYGVGEAGLPAGADDRRRALAWQLKGYLLFFDQAMANACAQLAGLRELFSTDPDVAQTYFTQKVDSFADAEEIYGPGLTAADLAAVTEDAATLHERRNRFLDHLVARFAERFHDYVAIMRSAFGADAASVVRVKCDFLKDYPARGAERGLGHDNGGDPAALWDSDNVSGLERRLGRLLGIENISRRELGGEEGMLLIESLLLRPETPDHPFLPICVDSNCADCADLDPYSCRLHIVLPAQAGRFANMDFRRFVEEVIREETPAHLLPRICWVSEEDMSLLAKMYRLWLEKREDPGSLRDLIDVLVAVKNVYPEQKLHGCDSPEDQPKFILGRSALGSVRSEA